MISNFERFKQAFAERDKKQTVQRYEESQQTGLIPAMSLRKTFEGTGTDSVL
jgi:hypothetical protein